MAIPLDADDLEREEVPLAHYLFRVPDASIDQLRDVDQPLHRTFNAGERAESDELSHQAGDHLPFLILINDGVPYARVGAPYAEGDLLVLCVDLGNVDIYLVTHLEQLCGRLVALPSQLREMGQSIRPS